MKKKSLSVAILSIVLVSAMFSASSNKVQAAESQVTLAGGGKTYGGVFAAGPGDNDDESNTFWNIVKAYNTKLLEDNLPNSGWNQSMMVGRGLSAATKDEIKNATNRFKPGGATPLQPGDEFQFYFVGHGRVGQDALGKVRYEFALADGVVTMDRMPYDNLPEGSSLREWLSDFPPSVTIGVILVTCWSKTGAEKLRDAGITDSEGNPLDSKHLRVGWSADGRGSVYDPSFWNNTKVSDFTEELIKGIENTMDSSDIAIMKDVIDTVAPIFFEKNTGDNDGDGKIDEDAAVPGGTPGENAMCYDDDGDGQIDEDPFPQVAGSIGPEGPEGGFGGIVVPVDKLGLLAPYIGLASTIIVATVVTAIYFKRIKRRKENQ